MSRWLLGRVDFWGGCLCRWDCVWVVLCCVVGLLCVWILLVSSFCSDYGVG